MGKVGINPREAGSGFSEKYGCLSASAADMRLLGSYVSNLFIKSCPFSDNSLNFWGILLYLGVKGGKLVNLLIRLVKPKCIYGWWGKVISLA